MSRPLENRIALVTGASRGIGRAVAVELARQGAHVIALARTQGGLEELDDEIRGLGGEATLVPCDLKDFDALDRLGAAIFERWGKLDMFVGNAALLGAISPLPHLDPKEWDKVMAVNVTANYRLIRSLDMLLRASDAGRVVLMSSGAGTQGRPVALSRALRHFEGRASTRSGAPTPPRRRRRRTSASRSSRRATCARACARRPCPAKTR